MDEVRRSVAPLSPVDRWTILRLEPRRLLSTAVGWDGTSLLIEDEFGDQADELNLSVSDDGQSLVVRDDGQTLTTSIVGAVQVDPHEIRIDFSLVSAAGVDTLRIATRGESDSIRLDLSQHADSFLARFDRAILDAGSESGDRFAIVGDRALNGSVELGSTAGLPETRVDLTDGSSGTEFVFASSPSGTPIDLIAFDRLSITTDGGDDQLTLTSDLGAIESSQRTIVISGTSSGRTLAELRIGDVDQLSLDTSTVDGDDRITIDGVGGGHGVRQWHLTTADGDDLVSIASSVSISERLTIETGTIQVSGDVNAGISIELIASREVRSTGDLTSSGGGITIESAGAVEQSLGSVWSVDGRNAPGGLISIRSAGGDLMLDGVLTARGDTGGGGQGTNGGRIEIIASAGSVDVGTIDVRGGNGSGAGSGGVGGAVRIEAKDGGAGDLTLASTIDARGGIGGDGSERSGGSVELRSDRHLVIASPGVLVSADELLVKAGGGVASSGTPLSLRVNRADLSASGMLYVEDVANGLVLFDLDSDGRAVEAAGGSIAARSPLTIASDVLLGGSFSFIAGNSTTAGDDLSIVDGATIELIASGGSASLLFQAGDDLLIVDGRIITSGGNHLVKLVADAESDLGVTDGDGGRLTQGIDGATVIRTQRLTLDGPLGIGQANRILTFEADELSSFSQRGDGDQFLRDVSGDLAVARIDAGSGSVLLGTTGSLLDPSAADGVANVTAGEVALTAGDAIGGGAGGDFDVAVDRLSAIAVTSIDLADADSLIIGSVGGLDGIVVAAGSGSIAIDARDRLEIEREVRQGGTGSIELSAGDVAATAAEGDVIAAGGTIDFAARGGSFSMVAGVEIVGVDRIRIAADDLVIAGGSRLAVDPTFGSIELAPYTTTLGLGLGDAAIGAWRLDNAEIAAIEAPIVRIGSAGGGPFVGSTSGRIDLRDLSTSGTFASDRLVLRTTGEVTGGGDLDLSATGSDLAIRSGGTIDLTGGGGDRNLGVVAATTGGAAAAILLDDSIDGLTIGSVDGVVGLSTGRGPIRVTTTGVESDLLVLADVRNSGNEAIALQADDAIAIGSGVLIRGTGTGRIEVAADRDGLLGDGIGSRAQARDSIVFAAGATIDAGAGTVSVRTDGGAGTGGSILLGTIRTLSSRQDAISVASDERIEERAADGAVDLSARSGGVVLTARSGIGSLDRIEIAATDVRAEVTGDGPIRLRSVSGAATTIRASVLGAGRIDLFTSTDELTIADASTGDGAITIRSVDHDLEALSVVAGGGGDIRIETIGAGDSSVDRVVAADDRITLLSAGSISASDGDASVDLIAGELVMGASDGIGANRPLEASVASVEAHGGAGSVRLFNRGPVTIADLDDAIGATGLGGSAGAGTWRLVNDGAITVGAGIVQTGLGGVSLEVVDFGSIDVAAPLLAFGGDVRLTAGSASGDLLIVRDSLPNGQAEIFAGAGGRVVGSAGGAVRFVAPAGGHVLVATDTGSATAVAPQLTAIAVDQGGSNVDSLGSALVDVSLRSTSGAALRNFALQLDWNDLIDPIDRFPVPGNPIGNPSTRFDLGTYRFFHNYSQGHPDPANPADDIPFDLEVRYDPRPSLSGDPIYGIEFFVDGSNVSVTTVQLFLSVPGDGLFAAIVLPPAEIERIPDLPTVPIYLPEAAPPSGSDDRDEMTAANRFDDESRDEGARLFYRVVGVDGTDGSEEYELPIEFLEEGRLFEFFKQLPNSRYNVYFKESGADESRTLFRLNVDGHRLVPLDFEQEPTPGDPTEPESNDSRPSEGSDEAVLPVAPPMNSDRIEPMPPIDRVRSETLPMSAPLVTGSEMSLVLADRSSLPESRSTPDAPLREASRSDRSEAARSVLDATVLDASDDDRSNRIATVDQADETGDRRSELPTIQVGSVALGGLSMIAVRRAMARRRSETADDRTTTEPSSPSASEPTRKGRDRDAAHPFETTRPIAVTTRRLTERLRRQFRIDRPESAADESNVDDSSSRSDARGR